MDCSKKGREDLEKEGFRLVCVTSEPRLSEIYELYRELGYEVRLEDALCDMEDEICRSCILADRGRIKAVYIRGGN